MVENGTERVEGGESESELDLLAEAETESDSDDQDNTDTAQRSVRQALLRDRMQVKL